MVCCELQASGKQVFYAGWSGSVLTKMCIRNKGKNHCLPLGLRRDLDWTSKPLPSAWENISWQQRMRVAVVTKKCAKRRAVHSFLRRWRAVRGFLLTFWGSPPSPRAASSRAMRRPRGQSVLHLGSNRKISPRYALSKTCLEVFYRFIVIKRDRSLRRFL